MLRRLRSYVQNKLLAQIDKTAFSKSLIVTVVDFEAGKQL